MTAVVSPPTFPDISRSAWAGPPQNTATHHSLNSINTDGVRGILMPPRKAAKATASGLARSNSLSSSDSSSVGSLSSVSTVGTNGTTATTATVGNRSSIDTPPTPFFEMQTWSNPAPPRLRPHPKAPWPILSGKNDEFMRSSLGTRTSAAHGGGMQSSQPSQPPHWASGHAGPAPGGHVGRSQSQDLPPQGQAHLYLLSLNGSFERKTIAVPFAPECLRIGRQTNQKTVPTPTNGYFDSKVLSRQHAEIWAERNGKIYIRDVKSSNGTFVNGTRLSQENRESEPHELQAADHLELGIDIVNEDQKTVVHHKVSAKVELAGFLSPTNSVLDMSFGDLDPANGGMGMPNMMAQYRGRMGGNPSMAGHGRVGGQANSIMAQQRPFWLSQVTTDLIVKKLHHELRGARLQSQELGRTGQLISALTGKDNVKDSDRGESQDRPAAQSTAAINGNNGVSFHDAKARFSEPPAPPPQQPLPEKPDVPGLKRAPTERSKPHTNGVPAPAPAPVPVPVSAPVPAPAPVSAAAPAEPVPQVVLLTEALVNSKTQFDSQSARVRELEDMLREERAAREVAENLASRLGDSALARATNGSARPKPQQQEFKAAFEPPHPPTEHQEPQANEAGEEIEEPLGGLAARDEQNNTKIASLQARLDMMTADFGQLKSQMESWKMRCEHAETERDETRRTLAEIVAQAQKDEQQRLAAARRRTPSRPRRKGGHVNGSSDEKRPRWAGRRRDRSPSHGEEKEEDEEEDKSGDETAVGTITPEANESPAEWSQSPVARSSLLSRANTITPRTSSSAARGGDVQVAGRLSDDALSAGLPYASMLGVVLLGMGLMAYLNGWTAAPPKPLR